VKDGIKLVRANNLVNTLSKTMRKLQNIFENLISHKTFDCLYLSNGWIWDVFIEFQPPLTSPIALEDDLLIEVFITIIALIRCLLICERQNQISKGKSFRKYTQ